MSETTEIKVTTRDVIGKANRRLAADQLAAVVYGHGSTPTPVVVDRHDFEQLVVHEEGLFSRVIKLIIDGHKPVNVIVKAVQRDVTKGGFKHVDFWAVRMNQTIQTSVALHFLGEAPGVKTGGVMMHNIQQVAIEALPANLPESLEVDISGLEVGDSVHISDIAVPEGVTILDPLEEIVASVVPPAKAIEEEVTEEGAAEPEVIGAADEGSE
jgi:large subunit ribosomal protein L25